MTRGLHHVEVNVADLDASIALWGWLLPELGFEPCQSWEEGRSWRCEDTYVVFVQAEPEFREQAVHRKRPGLNHLAFWARSTEHVRELTDALRARGVHLLYEDRGPDQIGAPSECAVFFEDPDRIKVEIVAPET